MNELVRRMFLSFRLLGQENTCKQREGGGCRLTAKLGVGFSIHLTWLDFDFFYRSGRTVPTSRFVMSDFLSKK